MSFAFVFPGQGSQSVGMVHELAGVYSEITDTFREANEVLGFDLWQIVEAGPVETLNQTQVTQPAMLAAGVAVWRTWCAQGGTSPNVVAGHSLGEYSALVCAQALSFVDALRLVADRSRFMQEAVPAGTGAMGAILGMSAEAVEQVCAEAAQGEVVEPANFNSPVQVVVGGAAGAVDRALALAKQKGAKRVVRLPMSAPSHCSLMHPAAKRMAERLKRTDIQAPRIPVINNVNAAVVDDAQAIRDALARQIEAPVRWVEVVQKIAASGATRIMECGPGRVLTSLGKRIVDSAEHLPITDSATLRAALSSTAT
jgi:[acyl-carrier-protein] S-malonyltransferase